MLHMSFMEIINIEYR